MKTVTLISLLKRIVLSNSIFILAIFSTSVYGLDSIPNKIYNSVSFPLENINLPEGSLIIDMGVVPQTIENGIKPYGLVHSLLKYYSTPVIWSINPLKDKDGIDFVVDGRNFRGAPFIVSKEFLSDDIISEINLWEAKGVVTYTTQSSVSVPVYRELTFGITWVLNEINDGIAEKYLENAEIPDSDYYTSLPSGLTSCEDIFIIPHADPDWEGFGNPLLNWNESIANGGNSGWIWAGCQAVSNLEGDFDPNNTNIRTNFLAENPTIYPGQFDGYGLIDHGDHKDASGIEPYLNDFPTDPLMQFIGRTDGAHDGGSEQIYLPYPTGNWRSTTKVAVWDPNQENVLDGDTPGKAALIAYGRAFGDSSRGMVLYEGGHELKNGSEAENVAAQRVFFNFSFEAPAEKAPVIIDNESVPSMIVSGESIQFDVTSTATNNNTVSYEWSSTCPSGSFSNSSISNPVFTAGFVSAIQDCNIRLKVTDSCGRVSFKSWVIRIIPFVPEPTPRSCDCSPYYNNSNFSNPQLIAGSSLSVGAVYRFPNVFPNNQYGTTIDALVRIEEFANGASLLNIDVNSTGLPEAFQPRINATNNNDQSVLFNLTFVTGGGTYGDEVVISFFGTPLDIDGNSDGTREYGEISLPDAYYVSNNTELDITQTAAFVRGEAMTTTQAPGGDVSLDPRWTYSNYFENKSSLNYRIGKVDGSNDRYYSLDMDMANYNDPNSVLVTYPVICGKVTDLQGNPLLNVNIDVTGSDGSSQTVITDASGHYKAIAAIPEIFVDVDYQIRENDLSGYISVSDVDGANDNLISRTINLASTCGNDFVDGVEPSITIEDKTDILCNGEATGSISVNASGGVPPYLFNANGGPAQSSPIFNDLPAGAYTIELIDSLGNTASSSITLLEPEALSVNITKENATTDQGCQNGSATATVGGGTAPYTYLWSASAGDQTTETAINLPDGTHTVTITDANGCVLIQGVVIDCSNTCDQIVAIDLVTDILCIGDNTGSTTVSASSGYDSTRTFTFTWNTTPQQIDSGVTTSTLTGLTAGIYTVSVTIDGTVCLPVEESVTIVEPANALNVSATATDESGPTTVDGTATAIATGGTPPYTYSWSPGGETTEGITGLSAGDYTITVTDANGCTAVANTTVNPGSCQNLSVTATATSATCNGDTDGTATANVTGGSGSFTYSWSPGGATTQTITGLGAGAYVITITDSVTLCTVQATATINEPNELSSGIAISNVLCFGGETGSLDLTVSGGTFPYTFAWDNGATTEDINNLAAGTYSVTITDVNGCVTTDTATIVQPSVDLIVDLSSQTDIVCDISLGSVLVEASGGTSPYLFNIDGGSFQNTGLFTDLQEGTYTINIIDANGCDDSITVTILANCTNAENDINNTFEDTSVSGNVLTNDTDPEGDPQTVTTTTVTTVQGVVVTIDPNTGEYVYTPPAGFVGEDSFEYTICDDGNPQACDTATVYIEVLPIGGPDNEAPIANSDTAGTEEDTPVSGNVLSNDFDPDGDVIVVTTTTVTTAEGVVVTIDPNTGEYVYTPPAGFTGEDSFEYTICDDGNPALCDTAVVVITVAPDTGNITVANDDAYNGTPGATVSGNVLDNDSDPEGDMQTVNTTPVDDVDNGTLVLNSDGTFSYVPNDGFTGTDSFVYSVCDDGTPQACDQATVYITVGGTGNTTDAENDINNTFADTSVSGNVLTNDTDAEGNTQTVTTTTVTTAQGVVVTIDPNTGEYEYTPPAGYVGEDSFEYTVCDDGNPQACDTATVYIEVLPVGGPDNEAPIANADTVGTEVDTPVSGNVLSNDFDPDGDPIVVTTTTVTTAEGVVVTIDPNTGDYTYTPPLGFTGEDSFEYTICDNGNPALCDTAVVVITVVGDTGNITVANDDTYNTTPGAAVSGNVTDNDSDPEGDMQTVNTTPVDDVDNGTLVLNADGTFTYIPNDGFTGTDSFVYSVCDDGTPQACDQATVYITVGGTGNTTDAENDINNTFADTSVSGNVLTNDTDAEGDTQTVTTTTVTTVQGVVVTIDPNTGEYEYTPPAGYVGEDSFEYTVCDDGNPQACDTATVYIEVLPVGGPDNEAPIANADTAGTEGDTPVSGNVLSNDFDPDGDPIVVTTTTVTTAEGVVVTIDPNTGDYTYTPPLGFTGEDSFEYTICDNGNPALCDTAVVVITVVGDTGNITVANDDAYNTTPGATVSGNVLDNDSDPEGDMQTVNTTPVDDVDNGTLVLNADGTFSYVPNDGFTGTDSFVYSVCDDGTPQACDQATVYITVGGAGNTTDAENDINNTFADTAVSGNVLTNDTDAEGDTQTVTTTTVTTVQGVVVTIDPNTGEYEYTPPAGYVGEDSFEYTVCDDGNPQACDTATVYIEVLPVGGPDNEAPIANADTAGTEVDTPVSGNVLSNDFDPDGDPIVVTTTTVTTAEGVVVTIDPNTGDYTYTPPLGFTGEDSFEYTICDNGNPALCDTAVVVITVVGDTGNITVANDDTYNTTPGATVSGNVLDNDSDPEGDMQTVNTTPVDDVDNGTLVLNADGTFSYVPNDGFTGTDSFVYSVCDDGTPQACDQATVYITVGGAGNTTDAENDINNTFADTAVSGNVLTNDTDAEGDTQTVTTTTVTTVQGVVVTIDPATGEYEYTPPAGYVGEDSFEYTVCDDGNPQACDTATVYIEVLPVGGPDNEAPIANADTAGTEVDTPVSGNVLSNDFDPDGDPIVVTTTTVTTAEGVVVTIDPNTGDYTYTPPAGFTGDDSFEYTICDDGNPALCDTAVVVITVVGDTGNITVANDDTYNTTPGAAVSGNVTDNDSDPEGDMQTVNTTPVDDVDNGTLVLNADGTFTYIPNDGFTGTDSFVYSVCDDGTPQACDQATVYITVGGTGNTTDAENDINNTFADTSVSGNVLTNDTDAEGNTQTVTTTTVTTAQGVVVTIDPNTGEYEYTPPAGYVGEDSFEYTVCDDGNPQACDTATVYIEVLPVGGPDNEAPIANADTAGTEVDTPVSGNVLSNDFDPDGDPIVVTTTTVTTAEGVVVTIDPNTGDYTYTPPLGFTGEDSFEYTICDNGNPALCDTAVVVITVVGDTGNITVANDDTYNTTPGATVSGNVLDNDSDPEGDMQTVNTTPVDDVDNGTLVLNADGTFSYVPNDGFTGTDSFVYSVCDDGTPQACDQATVYITVGGAGNTTDAENDINNTFADTAVSGNVLTNDTDAEGDTQTVTTTTVTTVQGVVVTIDPNTGEYEYTPPAGYVGEDSFEYTVCDDGNPQACDTATVYIEVLPVGGPDNEAPIANADTAGTEVDTPVSGNVLSNDFDPDGDPIVVTTTTVTTAEGVVVTIDPNTGDYTYTPPLGFTGEDSFEYTICDDGNPALCDTAVVVITVAPDTGNITVANDDAYFNNSCDSINGNVSDNDSDPEGDMQTVSTTPVDDVDNGTLVLNADGTFSYVPNDGFIGTDSFVYSVCDDGTPQACDQATVHLTIPIVGLPEVVENTSLCAVDETESQIFDLFGLLIGDNFNTSGTWQVVSGDATIINNNEFDPTSIELIGENASEEITFSYTLPNSACSVEVTLEVHNRCAVLACGDEDLVISKVITPNGDMYNEFFEILGIEDCDYTIDLKIINRWGAIIFESNDYQNNWNGFVLNGSLGSADQVPSGTYYYIVSLINSGLKPISGPVYIGTK